MIKTYRSENNFIYIGGTSFGPAEDFTITLTGDYVDIYRVNAEIFEVKKAHYTTIADESGGVFSTAVELENYLNAELAAPRFSLEGHKHTRLIPISGKFDLFSNNNWSTWSDTTYGPNQQEQDLTLGNGAEPTVDWDGLGMFFPAGTILKSFKAKVRANNNDVDTLEVFMRVHDVDLTAGAAIDSTAEIGAITIVPVTTIDLDAGAKTADDMGYIDVSLADYEFVNDGDLHLVMRATSGTLTASRQLRYTGVVSIEV